MCENEKGYGRNDVGLAQLDFSSGWNVDDDQSVFLHSFGVLADDRTDLASYE